MNQRIPCFFIEPLTKCIDECVKVSLARLDEIEQETSDAEKGRNSLEKSISTWLFACVYLIKEFDKGEDTEQGTAEFLIIWWVLG